MSKGHTLQDPYLNALRKERIPVSIYLVNGIKLQGQVESFDQFVVLRVPAVPHWDGRTGLSQVRRNNSSVERSVLTRIYKMISRHLF